MTNVRKLSSWILVVALLIAGLAMAIPVAATLFQQVDATRLITYQVTLTNLTNGQPFSPPLAVTHDQSARLFGVNIPAGDAIAALAQDGNPDPLNTLLGSLAGVTDVTNVGQPLAPLGATTTFTISAAPGDFLSMAAMLVCTNDGIVGLDSATLPDPGEERTIALGAYDVGREENTEVSSDLVDTCSELGPFLLTGDPNGNVNNAAVATTPVANITVHPSVTGNADLAVAAHGWIEVATITISPLADSTTPASQAGTLTSTGTLTVTNAVTGTSSISPTTTVTNSSSLTAPTTTTATSATTITVTTLGVPSQVVTNELPADILALMEEVPGEEPTEDMQAVLDALAAFEIPAIAENSARNARKFPTPGDAVMAVLAARGESTAPEAVGDISHRIIPGPSEDGTLLRIITPVGEGPFPVVVYYHGGGWVIAGLDAYEASARALSNAANSIVVMVAYRQSPEVRFPAAAEDAYSAFEWVVENATEINGDPERIAVAGESAGGNLATVVSILARDRGTTLPVYQVLIYPVTQLVSTSTPSYETYADAVPLNRALMTWFATRYLTSTTDTSDPYASPLLMDDLSALPPATILTAEIDPLQSEGAAYAARLSEAGVDVVYQNFSGVVHEFFGMGAVLKEAQEAVALAAEGLQSAFATGEEDEPTQTEGITSTNTLTGTGALTGTGFTTPTDTSSITETKSITDTSAVSTTEANVVQVSLVEWAIEMPTELVAGPITFDVSNNGQRVHNFEIEGQGILEEFAQDLQAGESNSMTVDLAPGDYTIYCPVGNHANQGMELTLTVTE